MNSYLLIDFYSVFHRSRAALLRQNPEGFSENGIPTTGVFSTLTSVLSFARKYPGFQVVVCTDMKGASSRKEVNSSYKANRSQKDTSFQEEARECLTLLRYIFPLVSREGFEADDIIATLAADIKDEDEAVILSCDKDLLQLASDNVTVCLFNSAKRWKSYTPREVCEEFGIDEPWKITLVKALSGDNSDNIRGLHRVGDKTAAKEIFEATDIHGTLNMLSLSRFAEGKEKGGSKKFMDNLQLVLPLDAEVFLPRFKYVPKLDKFFQRLDALNINSLLKRKDEITSLCNG